MRLEEFLRKNGLNYSWLVKRLRVNDETARRWIRGEHMPSPALCEKIRRLTGGEVTANDFVWQILRRQKRAQREAAEQLVEQLPEVAE